MAGALRVVQVLPKSTGGIRTHVHDLAEHCVKHGDRVVVIDVGTRLVPTSSLRRALSGADVVHSHGFKAAVAVNLARMARIATGRRAPRHIVTLHNAVLAEGMKAKISTAVGWLAVRPADVVLGASADLVERAKALGARESAFVPVPAPPLAAPVRSRQEMRHELALAEDESLLLAVGRLAPQKSYSILLDAVSILTKRGGATPRFKLAIAGDGPERAQLELRIRERNLPVQLLGHRSDIGDLLAAADVFVLSSRWEARALVIQEALTAGVATVATAVGGLPELVGDAALLVPWNDPRALADAFDRVLMDAALRDTLAKAGPIQAATWPTFTEALDAARAWYVAEL